MLPEDGLDIIVQIFDADDNLLLEVDDGLSGESEFLEFELADETTYYIGIFGYNGAGGDFVMDVYAGGE